MGKETRLSIKETVSQLNIKISRLGELIKNEEIYAYTSRKTAEIIAGTIYHEWLGPEMEFSVSGVDIDTVVKSSPKILSGQTMDTPDWRPECYCDWGGVTENLEIETLDDIYCKKSDVDKLKTILPDIKEGRNLAREKKDDTEKKVPTSIVDSKFQIGSVTIRL